jgi:hypothetical protein
MVCDGGGVDDAAQIYRDKIEADKVDDEANNERQTMREYTEDWFFTKYGLRKLAKSNLRKMCATLLSHRDVGASATVAAMQSRSSSAGGRSGSVRGMGVSNPPTQPKDRTACALYLHMFGRYAFR